MAGERREREAAVAYWHQNIFEPANNLVVEPPAGDEAKRSSAWTDIADHLEPIVQSISSSAATFVGMVEALKPSVLDSDRYKEVLETARQAIRSLHHNLAGYSLDSIRRTVGEAVAAKGDDDDEDLDDQSVAKLHQHLDRVKHEMHQVISHDLDFRRLDSVAKRRIHNLNTRIQRSVDPGVTIDDDDVATLNMGDGMEVLEHNVAALKNLGDGEQTTLEATSQIAVVGTVLMDRVNRYLNGAADKESGTVTIKKGGSFSAGTLTVTGITNHRDVVEKVLKQASKKDVKFK